MTDFAIPGLMTPSTPIYDTRPVPIILRRGVTFSEDWSIPVADGDPDFTGYTATASVTLPGDTVEVFAITAIFTDEVTAILTLSLTSEETGEIAEGVYETTILLIAPDTSVEVLVLNNPVIVEAI